MITPPSPTTEQFQGLAAYEAVLAAPDFTVGRWSDATADADGVMQMPWFEYDEAVLGFIEAASARGFVVDYDWPTWAATPEGQALLADPGLVARASAVDLVRLVTTCIRADRFSEGYLAWAFESGLIGAIVRRAGSLAGSSS